MRKLTRRLVRSFGIVALFLAAALAGTAGGVLFAFAGDLPTISALDDYSPGTITRVLARDGTVVGDFATERRVLVTYEQIPPVLRNAILAAEDDGFFHHGGLRLDRVAVAAMKNLVRMRKAGGASTLTQQLARKLFLTDEKTWERKIKEALLTIQIEKRYTKEEIFTMYCNKMYWGHQTYGVEGASQLYFGKHASELTLDEAAVIAGIIQGNQRQSPYVNMKAATTRRNYTLDRMAAEGFIKAAEADAAKKRPIVTRGEPSRPPSIAPYFLETVRIRLEEEYGAKAVNEGGLVVRTSIDPALQRAANAALDAGLRRIDVERGFRKPTRNVLKDLPAGQTLDDVKLDQWRRDPVEGRYTTSLVTGFTGKAIQIRAGRWHGSIDEKGYRDWAAVRRGPEQALKKGDLVETRVRTIDAKNSTFVADLTQTPEVQGAVLALDNHTGQVLAMIGGQNFDRSMFNRAIQAQRQVGSLFKPFVYMAAIESGFTPISLISDEPVSYDVGPNQPRYEPKNFDHKYLGDITLRHALEDSRNVPTIRLMAELGPDRPIRLAHSLGITSPIPPYLSSAIGAAEGSLIEMTAAYAALANQGVRMAPQLLVSVADREGNILEDHRPEPHEGVKADTAYIINTLLQGVIRHGTAAGKAGSIDWPLGGKTGTTDDYTDAWFIGFDPDITVGVWVGLDQKKTLGRTMEGAHAALPIWVDIMKSWIDRRRKELPEKPEFERPGNVVSVLTPYGLEYFIAGTEPRGSDLRR
jgi:penicillin-binding protein 1A